jgi:hypothetical protein
MAKKFLVVLVVLFLSSASFAGFVSGTFLCTFPDDPTGTNHTWSFDYNPTDYFLSLEETIEAMGIDQVNMSATNDDDPTFRVTKYVTNETTVAWTSYELTLNGTGPTFTDTPSSDLFSSAVISNGGLKITYSGGTVNPGDEVQLNFKVLSPAVNDSWTTCLTQNPIPEPATLAILGLGGMALLRKRR